MALSRDIGSAEPFANQDSNFILPRTFDRYSRLLDAVLGGTIDHIWVVDCAGRLLYVGPACAQALGRDRAAMLGRTHQELDFPAQYVERLQREREQVLATGQPVFGVTEYMTVHGLRYYEYTLSPWHDPDGDVEAVLCTERDITEIWLARKAQQENECRLQQIAQAMKTAAEAEAVARESEERFRATFEQAAVGIALVGMEGDWLRFNRKLCDILGYTPDELLKLSYHDVRHPDEIEDGQRKVRPLLDGEVATYTVERRYFRKDGSIIWANLTISVVRAAGNSPSYYICVIEDITERKHQEAAIILLNRDLQHRVHEFETLVDTLPVAVYISDDPECKTMRGNTLAKEVLGNPPGSNLSNSAPEPERPESFRILRNGQETSAEELPMQLAARTGQPVRDVELDVVWSNGTTVNLYGNASPLFDEQGAVRGSIGGFVNISERRHYEHELQTANRRLQRAMQETHHRVKNNLQLIAALLELATDENTNGLPMGETRRLLHQILMLSGIHDILTNTAGSIQAQMDKLSSRELLERLLSLLKATAEHVRFESDVSDVALTIHQATALALISNELVNNAIKHGSSALRIVLTHRAGDVTLTVEDDGPGFPAQFDVQKAANTGLTLVQTLSRHDLRGDVIFENRIECGARVVVNFALPNSAV
jgi:PAS domain S-box-containing protein